jgi:hypothetical protein
LDFEAAAGIHTRVEKVKSVAREFDEIVRPLEQLDALIVQRAVEGGSDLGESRSRRVAIFRFTQGQILGPAVFAMAEAVSAGDVPAEEAEVPQAATVTDHKAEESALADVVKELETTGKSSSAAQMEQLAILKRWYYRSNRGGEIFFRDAKGNWPLRRILRGAQRALAAGAEPIVYS